jgi:hypothetical protein
VPSGHSSITINGVWGKVISGIILAAAMRLAWNQDGIAIRVDRMERGFDRIDDRLDSIETKVMVIVDRYHRDQLALEAKGRSSNNDGRER